ncbi:hypothetical protein NA57DRAFT_32944 [Rhizodiscina lignyota]|uniref:Transport protein particle subunit trs85-2 n=1 Tax=Rhizodiscina lignyota TaxID=1504668 RepID=A0A9P4MAN1_9PEZI|nr:hypothetical protein NA57DRAFT_32944 [Rhizodiscina lignyota]
MTSPPYGSPIKSPQLGAIESSIVFPKRKGGSPASSLSNLPYRRSNQSLSSLFASTSSLPGSGPSSGTATPTATVARDSVFSPGGTLRPRSPAGAPVVDSSGLRDVLIRSFAPHVAVLASADTDEVIRQKGFPGGFLQLIRPFGQQVQGKVTVRDSIGASKSFEDFGIRFTGLKDGLNPPKPPPQPRRSAEVGEKAVNGGAEPWVESFPAWARTGGDVAQIEELVDRHLSYAEMQYGGSMSDYLKHDGDAAGRAHTSGAPSPFYTLYFRRLLSALPMSPHETFSHPVACIIAISSRNPSPIEDLRRLYNATNTGDLRLPQWVNNEFLRYYVLVHDEDHDDISKSTALYEQMKRHFGLHCHLLRLRSLHVLPSDDDSVRLPTTEWISAMEELTEIHRRGNSETDADPTPCLFDSDVSALRTLVRELTMQSIIPSMERSLTAWNEQVLSRRRGLSGRFMSLSKRWTPFGSSSRNSSGPLAGLQASGGGTSGNYDSLQGFYRPESAEATMRKLADYAVMLRDFKLAASTYDLLRADFNGDKAWRYYAGANEMAAIATLLDAHLRSGAEKSTSTKSRLEAVDGWLETASYSYVTRCMAPFYGLRTLAVGGELLKMRGTSTGGDEAAKWGSKILEDRLVGPVGRPLFMERISASFGSKLGRGELRWGGRRRKAAFWAVLAVENWLKMDKVVQAGKMLESVSELYGLTDAGGVAVQEDEEKGGGAEKAKPRELKFAEMKDFIEELREAVVARKLAAHGYEGEESPEADETTLVEEVSEKLDARPHRMSLIGIAAPPPMAGMDVTPLSPLKVRDEEPNFRDDSFE